MHIVYGFESLEIWKRITAVVYTATGGNDFTVLMNRGVVHVVLPDGSHSELPHT